MDKAEEEVKPARRGIWLSEQMKYAEDILRGTAQWWRRAFFRCIFRPFIWFSYKVVGIYPPDGRDHHGAFIWFERQGGFQDEWRAIKDSTQYRFGFTTWVPLDDSLESDSCTTIQITPHAPKLFGKRNGHKKIINVHELDLKQLDQVERQARELIEQHNQSFNQ